MKKNLLLALMCLMAMGVQARTINLSNQVSGDEYTFIDGDVLTGTFPKSQKTRLYIKAGATITLSNAIIKPDYTKDYLWAGLECKGNATIVLKEGTSNTVYSFFDRMPAIYIPKDRTLTIKGSGTLIAHTNYAPGESGWGAAIGGGRSSKSDSYNLQVHSGKIILDGGTIEAYGGWQAAAIGSGWGSSCDGIEVTPNVDKLKAYIPTTEGSASNQKPGPYVLGAGADATCEYLYMNGRDYVDASASKYGVAKDDGEFTYIGWTGDLSKVTTKTKDVRNGSTITGKLTSTSQIIIPAGYTVYLENATIQGPGTGTDNTFAALTCAGNATIILKGSNFLRPFSSYDPGIYVPKGKTLTIKGTGHLHVEGSNYGAAIGGGYTSDRACGNIAIQGGEIYATKATYAAAIGGGYISSCGAITITSDVIKVEAIRGNHNDYSVGKGAGTSSCGLITVGNKTYSNGIKDDHFIYPNTQDVEEVPSDQVQGTKILRDGMLLIERNGKTFNAQGVEVR